MATKDPEEMLEAVYRISTQLEASPLLSELRLVPEGGTKKGELLRLLNENGEMTASQMRSELEYSDTTGALNRLYNAYLIDRRYDGGYVYSINALGRKAIQMSEKGDSDGGRSDGESEQETIQPWVKHDLNKSQYRALITVYEADGHKTSEELNKEYKEYGYESDGKAPIISSRLTELYNKGYIDRPPKRPYQYWVTDAGEKVIEDDDL